MYLLFVIQSLQLLMLCMNDQEFKANMNCVHFYFSIFTCEIIKFNQFFLFSYYIFYIYLPHFVHTRYLIALYAYVSMESTGYIVLFNSLFLCIMSLLVPYAHATAESIECILLLGVNVTLLTALVNTLCFLLLNFCCDLILIYCFLWILYDFLLDYII